MPTSRPITADDILGGGGVFDVIEAEKTPVSLPAEMATGFKRGLFTAAPEMAGGAMKAFSPVGSKLYDAGTELQDSAKAIANFPELQKSDTKRGIAGDTLVSGAEGLGQMAPVLAGGVINPLLGAGIAGGMYGGSTYQDTKERMLKQEGLDDAFSAAHPDDERVVKAKRTALATGVVQGGSDAAMTYLGGRFLKGAFPNAGKQTAQGVVRGIATPGTSTLKQFGKAWGAEIVGEGVTEAAQDEGQAAVERMAGLKDAPAFGAQTADSARGGVGMALLLGPLAGPGHYKAFRDARQVQQVLADPSVEPALRVDAALVMSSEIAKVDPVAATNFMAHAHDAIGDESVTGSAPYALDLNNTALLEPFSPVQAPGSSSGETATPPAGQVAEPVQPGATILQEPGSVDQGPLSTMDQIPESFDTSGTGSLAVERGTSSLSGMIGERRAIRGPSTMPANSGIVPSVTEQMLENAQSGPLVNAVRSGVVASRGIADIGSVIREQRAARGSSTMPGNSGIFPTQPISQPSELEKAKAWAQEQIGNGKTYLMQNRGISDEQHDARILAEYNRSMVGAGSKPAQSSQQGANNDLSQVREETRPTQKVSSVRGSSVTSSGSAVGAGSKPALSSPTLTPQLQQIHTAISAMRPGFVLEHLAKNPPMVKQLVDSGVVEPSSSLVKQARQAIAWSKSVSGHVAGSTARARVTGAGLEPTPTQTQSSNTNQNRRALDATKDSLHLAVAKLGGISRADIDKQTGNGKDLATTLNKLATRENKSGWMHVITKTGHPLDRMRESLVEQGYLPGGATVNDLLDKLDSASRGTVHRSNQVGGAAAESEYDDQAARYQAMIESMTDEEHDEFHRNQWLDEQAESLAYANDVLDDLVDSLEGTEMTAADWQAVEDQFMEALNGEIRNVGTGSETDDRGNERIGADTTGSGKDDQREVQGHAAETETGVPELGQGIITGEGPAGAETVGAGSKPVLATEKDIPSHIVNAVDNPREVMTSVSLATKQQTKDTLNENLKNGGIPHSNPIRLTTVEELHDILATGKLREGKDYEGRSGISAQLVDGKKPIVAYGPNDKISAAVIFPESSNVGKGQSTNEVKVDARTDVKDLRFVIDGFKEVMGFDQLKKAVSENETAAGIPIAEQTQEDARDSEPRETAQITPTTATVKPSKPKTDSDSAQAINKRSDDESEVKALAALQRPGNTLFKRPKTSNYYIDSKNENDPDKDSHRLTPTRIKKLETAGVLVHVGENRYALGKIPGVAPLDRAAHEAATSPTNETPEPTQAQIEAGNYKKGHVDFQGLDISIENPAGSMRKGVDPNGKAWETELHHHYGYIKGTIGKDKDHIDVFIGGSHDSGKIFVVDQIDPGTGKFDEHKVMLGFDSLAAARSGYLKNYDKSGPQRIGAITETSLEGFKRWLKDGNTRREFAGELLLRVAHADDSGKSPSFPESGDQGQAENSRRSNQSNHIVSPAPEKVKPESKAKVTDAGEELTYNKRNRIKSGIKWDDVQDKNDALKAKEVQKGNVYPKPDYEALVADGMQPVVAHIVKQVYDSIAAKPSVRGIASDSDFQAYITAVNRVMDGALKWANNKDSVLAWVEKQAKSAGAMMGKPTSLSDLSDVTTLYDNVYPGGWREFSREVSIVGDNKVLKALQPGYSETRRALKEIGLGWPAKTEAWQRQGYKIIPSVGFAIKEMPQGGDRGSVFFVRKSTGTGHYQYLDAAHFYSKEEAQAFLEGLRPSLLFNKRSRLVDSFESHEQAVEAARNAVKKEGGGETIEERGMNVADAERTGPEHREEGENVTAEQLKDVIGFKGVNFGNWVPNDERQLHLNHAYDSFLDLADALNLPPRALSLNGMLGLAIGAQGSGSYAAHFVPGVNEINITRTMGAGSVAHEWAHAIDHYFAAQAGFAGATQPWMTVLKRSGLNSEVRPEIIKSFVDIVQAMKQREATPEELATRAKSLEESSRKKLESWLKYFEKEFSRNESAAAEFSVLADRIRKGDYQKSGDAYVTIVPGRGHNLGTAVLSIVADVRDLAKKYKIKIPTDSIKSLDSNVSFVKYLEEKKGDDHKPQMAMTRYQAAANKLDSDRGKSSKPYWSTPLEMFARAFDAYISDRLEAKAQANSYLSHTGRMSDTVPMGEERKMINKAFDALIGELKTRETDKGISIFEPNEVYLSAGIVQEANNAQLNLFNSDGAKNDLRDTGKSGTLADDRRRAGIQWYASAELPSNVRDVGQKIGFTPTGSFSSPIRIVSSSADAASFFTPLADKAKENLMMLILDKAGKPLALVDVSTGLQNQSVAHPKNIIGTALAIPGAESMWLGHNHPSGDTQLSREDRAVDARLRMLAEGSGLRVTGFIAMGADNQFEATNYDSGPVSEKSGKIRKIPVLDTRIEQRTPAGTERMSSPEAVARQVELLGLKGKSGLLLLDTKNRVNAVIEMSLEDMEHLRKGSKDSGHGLLMRAMAQTNSMSMALVTNESESKAYSAIKNVNTFANVYGVNLIEAYTADGSMREKGDLPSDPGGAFFALDKSNRMSGPSGLNATEAQTWAKTLPISKRVNIVQSVDELPANARAEIDKAGVNPNHVQAMELKGMIHVIADNVQDLRRIKALVIGHELAHAGQSTKIVDFAVDWFRRTKDGKTEQAKAAQDLLQTVARRYGYDLTNDKHFRLAVQEATAAYAEQAADGKLPTAGLMTRLFAYLKYWLRQNGLISHVSDSELSLAVSEMLRIGEKRLSTGMGGDQAMFAAKQQNSSIDGLKKILAAVDQIVGGNDEATILDIRSDLKEMAGTGDVTLVWGDDKRGLFHIGSKRGANVVGEVLLAIAEGKTTKSVAAKKTVHLVHGNTEAVLSLDEHGQQKTWLLAGWKIGEPDAAGEVGTRTGATQNGPTFSRSDLGAGSSAIIIPYMNNLVNPTSAHFALQDQQIAAHAAKLDAPGKVSTMTKQLFEIGGQHLPQRFKAFVGKFASNPWFGSEGKPVRRMVVNLNIDRSKVRNQIISDLFTKSEGYEGVEGLHNLLNKASDAEFKQFNDLIKYGDRNDVATTFTRDELYRGETPFGKLSRTVVESYKAFQQIIQATNRVRFDKLAEIALLPYKQETWYPELLDMLELRMNLDGDLESAQEVAQLAKLLSSTRNRMSDKELFGDNNPTKKPVTQAVADAYKKFMDKLETVSEPGLVRMAYKAITEYRGELEKIKNDWGQVKGYAPRMRKDGDWHVSVYRVNEDGSRTKVYMKPTIRESAAIDERAKIRKDLKGYLKGNYVEGEQYEVEYERNTATPSELLGDRGKELAIEQLIMNAFESANVFKTSAEDLAAMKRAILDEVAKEIMAQGFSRHGISREQTYIEGFKDDDYVSVIKEFISGMAGWLAKMQYAVEVNREADKISSGNPDDKLWVHNYFKDSMRISNYMDEIAATARSVGAVFYLGFKVSSAVLNGFQNYTVGQAVLAGMMKKAGRKGEAILMLAKAQRDMVMHATGKKKLNDEEMEVIHQAVRQGTAHAQTVRSMSGLNEQGFGSKWKKFVEVGMTPFSWVEQYVNREPGVLAAYRAFKTTPAGEFDQAAFSKAEEFTANAHFLMGSENLPELVRNLGAVGKGLYLFQGYTHNYMLLMANALKNGEFEVIARSFGAIAALGGVFALPGADDLDKWILKWFGVSYKLKFKGWMRKHAGEYGTPGEAIEAFINYGAPSVAGVDMSRAIGVNIPFVSDPDKTFGENLSGVWGGMVKKPIMAAQALGSGQYYRAIESMVPEFAANPMRAYRQATTGATTLGGKPILDETGHQLQYSGTDVAKKVMGFSPIDIAERTELKGTERELGAVWNDERKDKLTALRVAKTPEEVRQAVQDVIKWNRNLFLSQAKGLVSPIKSESIQRARQFKPGSNDKKRMAWEKDFID